MTVIEMGNRQRNIYRKIHTGNCEHANLGYSTLAFNNF